MRGRIAVSAPGRQSGHSNHGTSVSVHLPGRGKAATVTPHRRFEELPGLRRRRGVKLGPTVENFGRSESSSIDDDDSAQADCFLKASAATFSSASKESLSSVAFSSFRVSLRSVTADVSSNCFARAMSDPYDAIS